MPVYYLWGAGRVESSLFDNCKHAKRLEDREVFHYLDTKCELVNVAFKKLSGLMECLKLLRSACFMYSAGLLAVILNA